MTPMLDTPWLLALAVAMAATGLFSGLLAGLLGVGGGIVIVPVLFHVLPWFDVPEATQMKVAVATSLATIIPTSIISARKHFAKGTMDMPLLRSLAVPMFLGALLGTWLAVVLKGPVLSGIFAGVALVVAMNMGFSGLHWRLRESMPSGAARAGIGGGIGEPGRPPFSAGWVSLVGFALIAPASIVATPWGVRLAHTIPPLLLKRVFALFLALTSARMAWGLWG